MVALGFGRQPAGLVAAGPVPVFFPVFFPDVEQAVAVEIIQDLPQSIDRKMRADGADFAVDHPQIADFEIAIGVRERVQPGIFRDEFLLAVRQFRTAPDRIAVDDSFRRSPSRSFFFLPQPRYGRICFFQQIHAASPAGIFWRTMSRPVGAISLDAPVRFGSGQRPAATHAAPDGSERHHFLQSKEFGFERSVSGLLIIHSVRAPANSTGKARRPA